MYKTLKYAGAAGWAFTYVCFIVISIQFGYSMIPLAVCSYNIAYELLYTILASDRGQRIRNGVWFVLDMFIIYNHVVATGDWGVFGMWFTAMILIQIALNWKISKEITKSFAWFATLLMAILLYAYQPEFWSIWVLAALMGKIIGDGFYGCAHLIFGVPGVKSITYNYVLKATIIAASALNILVLITYIMR